MKLREYEYILAIAREKNMNRAAQYLCVSQPALSRLLANVEAEMGVQLFLRRGREMVPTEAGNLYLENVSQIVEMNDQFENKIKQIIKGHREIILACPAIRTDFLIKNILVSAKKEMPDVYIDVRTTSQQTIINGLNKMEFPMAIGIIDDEYDRKFSYQIIGSEEMVLAVPKGCSLLEEAETRENCTYPFIAAKRLQDETFIFSRPNSYSARFANNFFQANDISPHISVQLPMTSMLIRCVAENMGVAIVPSIPLNLIHMEDKVSYLSIRDASCSQAIGVIYQKNRKLNSDEETLVRILRNAYSYA